MPQQTLAVATALNDPWKYGGMYKALYDDVEEKRYHPPARHHDDDGTRSHGKRRR